MFVCNMKKADNFFRRAIFFGNFDCFFLGIFFVSLACFWPLASVGFWLLLACGFCWLLASVGFWLLLAFGFYGLFGFYWWLLLILLALWLLLVFGFYWLFGFY